LILNTLFKASRGLRSKDGTFFERRKSTRTRKRLRRRNDWRDFYRNRFWLWSGNRSRFNYRWGRSRFRNRNGFDCRFNYGWSGDRFRNRNGFNYRWNRIGIGNRNRFNYGWSGSGREQRCSLLLFGLLLNTVFCSTKEFQLFPNRSKVGILF
jgi:hypothetical protein